MNEPIAPFNVAVITITAFVSYRGFVNPSIIHRYLFGTREILEDKQYYRLITPGVLHADWVHLLFNMFSLYSFGSAIEFVVGPVTFLATYLVAILGGNILALILHRKEQYHALGASGGVCGVIFACIFLIPGSSVQIFLIPVDIPAHVYAFLFMLISYFGIQQQRDNIGHDAHLGGAIIGLLTTTALHPYIIAQNPVLYPAVMVIAVCLMLLLYINPINPRPSRRFRRNDNDDQ